MLLCSGLASKSVSLRLRSTLSEYGSDGDETDGVEYLIEESAVFYYFDRFPFALLPLELLRIWSGSDSAPFDPVLQRPSSGAMRAT